MKISRKALLVSLFLAVGPLGFFVHSKYARRLNEELATRAESELRSLHLAPAGTLTYRAISANRHCNWSDITEVYSSKLSATEICSAILSSLPSKTWNRPNQCIGIERAAAGVMPAFTYSKLEARNSSSAIHIAVAAFPKSSSSPYFVPVKEYAELDITNAAMNGGNGFYYINLRYQGVYDENQYPCNDADTCECAYQTYLKSTGTFSNTGESR